MIARVIVAAAVVATNVIAPRSSLAGWAESCAPLLVVDEHAAISGQDGANFVRDAMCLLNFSEFDKKMGLNAKDRFALVSGGTNYDIESYNRKRTELCRNRNDEDKYSAYAYSASKLIPPDDRKPYLECLNRQTVACPFDERDPPGLTVYLGAKSDSADIDEVLTNNATVASKTFQEDEELRPGVTTVNLVNVDRSKPSRMFFHLTIGSLSETCRSYLPAHLPASRH
jgi:hypothetical protein